ncbi:MAG: hypothetical protein LBB63_04340 [Holosporaceae bacterium]|jgi:hypothetical protein|nr:hypothetical protein [Holosporaceae bacterium]
MAYVYEKNKKSLDKYTRFCYNMVSFYLKKEYKMKKVFLLSRALLLSCIVFGSVVGTVEAMDGTVPSNDEYAADGLAQMSTSTSEFADKEYTGEDFAPIPNPTFTPPPYLTSDPADDTEDSSAQNF